MTAKDYCIEIQKLLTEAGELNRAKCFENFISELELSKDNSAYRKIISIYGGMGSFDDLILYKDGVLCQKENDTLHTLKKELYKKVFIIHPIQISKNLVNLLKQKGISNPETMITIHIMTI